MATKKPPAKPKTTPKVKKPTRTSNIKVKSPAKVKPRAKRFDWDAIERDYRTDRYTLMQLEAKHGPSYETISRKATKEGWKKDLKGLIAQATSILVAEAASERAQKEVKETVAIAAEANKQVILGHRSDIADVRNASFTMLEELKNVSGTMMELRAFIANLETLELAAIRADEDLSEKDKERRVKRLQDEYDRVRKLTFEAADLHNRIGSAKALADTLTKLQTLERKAFGLDDKEGDDKTAFESVLDQVLE